MMIHSVQKLFCLVACFIGGTFASRPSQSEILEGHKEVLPSAVSDVLNLHERHLQWTIDVTPDSDPVSVCTSYNQQLNGTWECSCDTQPDKSVSVKCLELESKCNADSSLCYLMTVKVSLTPQSNQVIGLESCTEYVDLNLTRLEGSTTKLANYSDIVPCVKIDPVAPNDFTSLAGCSVTVNGAPCQTCEICTDNSPTLGITLDCCNTNPEGEQLKVTCGPVGGGGAYVPIFDTYEEGNMETCSGGTYAVVFGRLTFMGLLAMTALVGVV